MHWGGVYLDRMDLVQEQIKEWGIWLFLGQFCMSYSFSIFPVSAIFTCLVFLSHTGGEISSKHRHLDELLVSGKPTWNSDLVRMESTIFSVIWALAVLVHTRLVPKLGITSLSGAGGWWFLRHPCLSYPMLSGRSSLISSALCKWGIPVQR